MCVPAVPGIPDAARPVAVQPFGSYAKAAPRWEIQKNQEFPLLSLLFYWLVCTTLVLAVLTRSALRPKKARCWCSGLRYGYPGQAGAKHPDLPQQL
jgi:hypothetical protein